MSDRAIIESITKMIGIKNLDPVYYVNAIVNSVDISTRTCDCTTVDGHTEYDLPNVKLMAVVDDGLLIEPVIGSSVMVIFSQIVEPFICQYSEIQNITIIAANKTQLNDGSYGGLIRVIDLVTKLNNLEDLVNDLVEKFNSHTHILALSSGTGTAAVTANPETTVLEDTVRSDIENSMIVHGV